MGVIERVFDTVFGGGRNVIAETAGVFRVNAEENSKREAAMTQAAMAQFGAEFGGRSRFDAVIDGLNRLPRPALAFGTIGLFVSAMTNPEWFAYRMQGIALVPEPLWWLMGAIVSFYFGARHQAKAQDFQRSVAETMARLPTLVPEPVADPAPAAPRDVTPAEPKRKGALRRYLTGPNAALDDWIIWRAA